MKLYESQQVADHALAESQILRRRGPLRCQIRIQPFPRAHPFQLMPSCSFSPLLLRSSGGSGKGSRGSNCHRQEATVPVADA